MRLPAALVSLLLLCSMPSVASPADIRVFGTKQYLRSASSPNVYTDTFRGSEYYRAKIVVRNGDGNGGHRVSSARVVLNGTEVVAPGALNQLVSYIESPVTLSVDNEISVTLTSLPGSYISVDVVLSVTPDAVVSEEVGTNGGTLTVTNHWGDTLTLSVPPLALLAPTRISLSALRAPLPGPLNDNVYPGVLLEPEGLRFSVPAKITAALHAPLPAPHAALFYWRESGALISPLPRQTSSSDTVTADVYHFSEAAVAVPSEDELRRAVEELLARNTDGHPAAIVDDVEALLSGEKVARELNYEVADYYHDAAVRLLLREANRMVALPLPSNPCGLYTRYLRSLSDLITTLTGDVGLATEIGARGCTLTVSPKSLTLGPGGTGGLTAGLVGPAGEPRSCSVLNWYSSDVDVVTVTSTSGHSASVMAGSNVGAADVAANCDGQLDHSVVSIGGSRYEGYFTTSGSGYYRSVWGHSEAIHCNWTESNRYDGVLRPREPQETLATTDYILDLFMTYRRVALTDVWVTDSSGNIEPWREPQARASCASTLNEGEHFWTLPNYGWHVWLPATLSPTQLEAEYDIRAGGYDPWRISVVAPVTGDTIEAAFEWQERYIHPIRGDCAPYGIGCGARGSVYSGSGVLRR